ncbi:hypothetical protein Q8A73_013177 [Channa argus]|nr:hypothetical protein Q8A73_013177 [Channa argus]
MGLCVESTVSEAAASRNAPLVSGLCNSYLPGRGDTMIKKSAVRHAAFGFFRHAPQSQRCCRDSCMFSEAKEPAVKREWAWASSSRVLSSLRAGPWDYAWKAPSLPARLVYSTTQPRLNGAADEGQLMLKGPDPGTMRRKHRQRSCFL